ncbi:Hypothetical predicted protein [Mytilus galloprovincialis]|uniref:Uncharacterized protein n=1 Tax=Mytilus galloprovincialis TaxID=29158 RepID=A0A8B6FG42_MYTGA|nr:Hypothetical predicted protein [Mytilus galloprovincialis]
MSSSTTSPVSTPAHAQKTSPSQPPMISPASSVPSPTPVLTEQLPQTNSIGVHFKVGDNVCIASGGNTYDFATMLASKGNELYERVLKEKLDRRIAAWNKMDSENDVEGFTTLCLRRN